MRLHTRRKYLLKQANMHKKDKPESVTLLDRDLSILQFNHRVLDWAKRPEVPLLERLRFLCIVSSNLDEFFEVRAGSHLAAALGQEVKAPFSQASFLHLATQAHALVKSQYELFNNAIMPALAAADIHVLSHGERNVAQRRWVKQYFEQQVRPLLTPIALDPAHPFPSVANKSLNFIVRLEGRDAFGRQNEVAIVKVPRVLPRLIRLPDSVSGGKRSMALVSLSSVIRAHLAELFTGRSMGEFSQFRVTRHSDLAVDEEEVTNLRTALRQGLQHRHYGQAVRLEVSSGCSEFLSEFLLREFALPTEALYRVHGPVNLVRFNQLIDLVASPQLLFAPMLGAWPRELKAGVSIFSQLKHKDVLIHQPFESFQGVLEFLREAVYDPQVLAIRMTIYRTGAHSELMDLLGEAVRNGKEVTAVLELKARFEEETNINWADSLEAIGAQVVYGVVGLKTHAKMLLVTRREGKLLKRYGHLSTGNYNIKTAKLYTDLSMLTANPQLTADMDAVFVHLAGQSKLPRLKHLWLAPFELQNQLVKKIALLANAAANGQSARLVAKMNALTDERLIHALIAAGQAGVSIDLIVRGACMLPPQLAGVTDNIRVRSVIGQFLEHSRIFYFAIQDTEEVYLSSADWMGRNMIRRIELAWPVLDPVMRQRVVDECLIPYLHDGKEAWALAADGSYQRAVVAKGTKSKRNIPSAQDALRLRFSPQT